MLSWASHNFYCLALSFEIDSAFHATLFQPWMFRIFLILQEIEIGGVNWLVLEWKLSCLFCSWSVFNVDITKKSIYKLFVRLHFQVDSRFATSDSIPYSSIIRYQVHSNWPTVSSLPNCYNFFPYPRIFAPILGTLERENRTTEIFLKLFIPWGKYLFCLQSMEVKLSFPSFNFNAWLWRFIQGTASIWEQNKCFQTYIDIREGAFFYMFNVLYMW